MPPSAARDLRWNHLLMLTGLLRLPGSLASAHPWRWQQPVASGRLKLSSVLTRSSKACLDADSSPIVATHATLVAGSVTRLSYQDPR